MRTSLNTYDRSSSSSVDDGYMGGIRNAGMVSKVLGGLCSCASLGAAITLTVYLGIYAFNNPDP